MMYVTVQATLQLKKNGGVEEYQYGEWLKTSSGRPRSPPWEGSMGNNQPVGTGMIMTTEIHGMDNIQREDNSKNHGISFATQHMGIQGTLPLLFRMWMLYFQIQKQRL